MQEDPCVLYFGLTLLLQHCVYRCTEGIYPEDIHMLLHAGIYAYL